MQPLSMSSYLELLPEDILDNIYVDVNKFHFNTCITELCNTIFITHKYIVIGGTIEKTTCYNKTRDRMVSYIQPTYGNIIIDSYKFQSDIWAKH